MKKTLQILKTLNDIPLVSTREYIFISVLEKQIHKWLPKYSVKNIENNLIVIPPNKIFSTIFFAHIDEIGFVVKKKLSQTVYELDIRGLINISSAHGSAIQTKIKNKIFTGTIGNVMPHTKGSSNKLFAEFSENTNLPIGWPVTFANNHYFGKRILSKTLDNRFAVACLISTAMKKNIAFALTIGEEESKQKFSKLLNILPKAIAKNSIIVIDGTSSNADLYYTDKNSAEEGSLGIVPIEGGGKGNIAPKELVKKTLKQMRSAGISATIIKTYYEDDISDSTALCKLGCKTIQVCYPMRYMHNAIESANIETIYLLKKFLENC